MKALIDKSNFIGLDQCTWLFCGAESPVHRGALEAVHDYMNARTGGPRGRERNAETEWKCKTNLAALIGGNARDIALMSNASEAISMVAQAAVLQPGDNVIINKLEFPSGILPWLALKQQGVEVRVVEHTDWGVDAQDILRLVDDRTRLVMTSHVSYLSGARIDYAKLYEELQHTNALLLLDVTQSLGVVPVDLSKTDILVSSSYKWLLSTHGLGVLAFNPGRFQALTPKYIGWRSVVEGLEEERFASFAVHSDARRFELGYPSYPTVYVLEYTTRLLLETGIGKIESHVLKLGGMLIRQLEDLGLQVMTPAEPSRRAGNISFAFQDAAGAAARLLEHEVYVMGGDNRVRSSLHAYNDADDVKMLIDRLPAALK